jgi:ABC-type uncharacterized transport system permease subunit
VKKSPKGAAGLRDLRGVALAVAFSLLAGLIIILIASRDPSQALTAFFLGPFSSVLNLSSLATTMAPLVVTGLALCISFQATVWNLAAEGQVYVGAFIGVAAGLLLSGVPPLVALPLMLVAAFAAGAVVSLLPASLWIACDANELIVSFMTSLLLLPIVNYFLAGPMKAPGAGINATASVDPALVLPRLFGGSNVTLGLPLAMLLVPVLHVFLYSTPLGTALRLYGHNRTFAFYAGIGGGRIVFTALALSGGLCGLAGALVSLGTFHGRMVEFSTFGMGWNGIAVALVARFKPAGVLPAAFLLAYLLTGANLSGLMSDVPPEVSRVVISVIFFLVTSGALSSLGSRRKGRIGA